MCTLLFAIIDACRLPISKHRIENALPKFIAWTGATSILTEAGYLLYSGLWIMADEPWGNCPHFSNVPILVLIFASDSTKTRLLWSNNPKSHCTRFDLPHFEFEIASTATADRGRRLEASIKSNQIKSQYLLKRPSSVAQGRKYRPTTTMQIQ